MGIAAPQEQYAGAYSYLASLVSSALLLLTLKALS